MNVDITVTFNKQDVIRMVEEKVISQGLKIKEGTLRTLEGRQGDFIGIELKATMDFDTKKIYTERDV